MLKDIILNELKSNFLRIGGFSQNDFISSDQEDARFFYLDDYNKNLVSPMSYGHIAEYSKGNGKELEDRNSSPAKMKSIQSSSALTFNLIGNDFVKVKKSKYGIKLGNYKVQYEKELDTLVGSPSPATLDACLISEDNKYCVFCEMKLFEWLDLHSPHISDSYLNAKKYFNIEAYNVFEAKFRNLKNTKYRIRYDAPQMLKHLLGIYNILKDAKNNYDNEFHNIKKVMLLNCVWEVNNPLILGNFTSDYLNKLNQEHNEYQVFKSSIQQIFDLFKKEWCYSTYKDLI